MEGLRKLEMLERYKTLGGRGEQEIVIRKSRFIGYARPVGSEAEAIAFIEEIKKKHWNASHNCSAYVLGERDEIQKQSDDGEPSGTAGKPILEVIRHQQLKDTAVVVTRYFGGIMLGAGGLIRAYTDGAVAGIAAAGVLERALRREVHIGTDYGWYGKLEHLFRERQVRLADTAFTDQVRIVCLPEAAEAEAFAVWITDVTQGQAQVTLGEAAYYDEP